MSKPGVKIKLDKQRNLRYPISALLECEVLWSSYIIQTRNGIEEHDISPCYRVKRGPD